MIRIFFSCLILFLPCSLKLFFYRRVFGFYIGKNSKIGFSLILCKKLHMSDNTKIGHLNVIRNLDFVNLALNASIGNLNWIFGFPSKIKAKHFVKNKKRLVELHVGMHSSITNRHLIDCTDLVIIGKFSTFAGFRSQILTHSISISHSRQESGPVEIGNYTFVGTGSIILPNSTLPNYSIK